MTLYELMLNLMPNIYISLFKIDELPDYGWETPIADHVADFYACGLCENEPMADWNVYSTRYLSKDSMAVTIFKPKE